jgi:hypothetical protein
MKPLLSITSIILTATPAYSADMPQGTLAAPATSQRPVPKWIRANDANKNGKLDPQEISAIKTDLAVKRVEFKRQFDSDGDGKMSVAELKVMRQTLVAQRAAKEKEMRNAVEKQKSPAQPQ